MLKPLWQDGDIRTGMQRAGSVSVLLHCSGKLVVYVYEVDMKLTTTHYETQQIAMNSNQCYNQQPIYEHYWTQQILITTCAKYKENTLPDTSRLYLEYSSLHHDLVYTVVKVVLCSRGGGLT